MTCEFLSSASQPIGQLLPLLNSLARRQILHSTNLKSRDREIMKNRHGEENEGINPPAMEKRTFLVRP